MAATNSSNATTAYDQYNYTYDYEDEMCYRTNINKFTAIFIPVFFSIVVILSLFGNILVIVILSKYENLKSLTNAFILNLAMSDLLFTAGLPFWAYSHMYGWTLGEPACKIVNFVFYIGFYSSGIVLILMTVHRYVAVMNPFSDIVSTKGFYSVLASVMIWAVSILVASPAFVFTKVMNSGGQSDSDQNICDYNDSYGKLWGIYQQNILFLVSSVVFVFCYSLIIYRLLRPTAQRRKNKTLKLIFILMVVFFVTWGPYNITIFLNSSSYFQKQSVNSSGTTSACEKDTQQQYIISVSRFLAYSHCCLNPVFYVFVGVKFKNHLKKMMKSLGHRNTSIRSRHSRLTITSLTGGEELSM